MAILTVFVSSTCEDLKKTRHREAIRSAVEKLRLRVEMMEYWETGDNPPFDASLQRVAKADLLIVAVAHRFGWIPAGQHKSITWLECQKARESGKKILPYIIDPGYAYPLELRDQDRLTRQFEEYGNTQVLAAEFDARIKGLRAFKEWLSVEFSPQPFTSAEVFAKQVEIDLLRWLQSQDSPTGSFRNRHDGSRMVRVPAGNFMMGPDPGQDSDGISRPVDLDEFYISECPVTNKQYRLFVDQSKHRPSPIDGDPDHPVVGVSWEDSQAYCRWAHVRLPNEYQWEKAARGPDGRKYPWGNFGPVEVNANCVASDRKGTTSVKEFPNSASPYGCFDMVGNVFEWCLDPSDSQPDAKSYSRGAALDDGMFRLEDKVFRVVRGGAWNDVADRCQCSYRGRRWQEYEFNNVGFRVVFAGITQDMLDSWLGKGNWFCYPDRLTAVGVTKLPKIEEKPELIDYIEAGGIIYDDRAIPEIGANVELRLPIGNDQIPAWQRTALRAWKEDRERDAAPLTGERLDDLFAAGKWSRDPVQTFLVNVELLEPFELRYPITTLVDAGQSRYGIGQVCPRIGPVQVCLAGDLPEEYVRDFRANAASPQESGNS